MLINLCYSYIIEFLIEKFNPTTVEIPNVFFLCLFYILSIENTDLLCKSNPVKIQISIILDNESFARIQNFSISLRKMKQFFNP